METGFAATPVDGAICQKRGENLREGSYLCISRTLDFNVEAIGFALVLPARRQSTILSLTCMRQSSSCRGEHSDKGMLPWIAVCQESGACPLRLCSACGRVEIGECEGTENDDNAENAMGICFMLLICDSLEDHRRWSVPVIKQRRRCEAVGSSVLLNSTCSGDVGGADLF